MFLPLIATASAVDLDARFTTPSGEVTSLTFHDVESSPPPTFHVEMEGETVAISLRVTATDGAWVVAADLAKVDKRGRARLLAAPQLTVLANEVGMVRQGGRVAIVGTRPVAYREVSWELSVMVRPE